MKRLAAFIMALTLPAVVSFAAQAPGTSAPPGSFAVTSVSIFFANQRPEITVSRADSDVRATADIATTGSGLLEGYWEMDGRVVGRVSRHIAGVGGRTLTTQKSPVLPTGTPGSHIIRFVAAGPAPAAPSALLFVVPEGAPSDIGSLALLQPPDGADLDYSRATFSWEPLTDSTTYLVSFHRSAQGKPIFAAYTQSTSYTLPELALKKFFRRGKKYFWRVACFDPGGHATCVPRRQGFGFRR